MDCPALLYGGVCASGVSSERMACLPAAGRWRGIQHYEPLRRIDEEALTRAIIALATEYCRYGYRRITVKVRGAGWPVSVERRARMQVALSVRPQFLSVHTPLIHILCEPSLTIWER
jgi:hypothetical protein